MNKLSMLFASIIILLVGMKLGAQSATFCFLPQVTSLSQCAWPSGVTSGIAFCPIVQGGAVTLALAANGGGFRHAESGATGTAGITGSV